MQALAIPCPFVPVPVPVLGWHRLEDHGSLFVIQPDRKADREPKDSGNGNGDGNGYDSAIESTEGNRRGSVRVWTRLTLW